MGISRTLDTFKVVGNRLLRICGIFPREVLSIFKYDVFLKFLELVSLFLF